MNFPIFHGLKLAAGGSIRNAIVETILTTDELSTGTLAPLGKFWYSERDGVFKFKDSKGVTTFNSVADATAAFAALRAQLAAATGSLLIGTDAVIGNNGQFLADATNLDAQLALIIQGVDTTMQEIATYSAAVAANTGATLVGTTGVAGLNNRVVTTNGTLQKAITDIVTSVDAQLELEADRTDTNFLNKTQTTLQNVQGAVTFKNDVTIDTNLTVKHDIYLTGTLIQNGTALTVVGTNVMFTDNMVFLNSSADPLLAPIANAGWGVNRGIEGETVTVQWIEAEKSVNALTTWRKDNFYTAADELLNPLHKAGTLTGTIQSVFAMDNIVVQAQLDHIDARSQARLSGLESKVGSYVGDLSTLHTTDKTTLVAAINETLDREIAQEASLVASTGSTLVGYAGKVGTNGKFTVAAGTVKASFDSVVTGIDANMQSSADYKAALANPDGLPGHGGDLMGAPAVLGGTGNFNITVGTARTALYQLVQGLDQTINTANTAAAALDATIANINAFTQVYEGDAAAVHTFTHNMNSEFLNVTVWTEELGGWQNSIVATTITGLNSMKVELTEAKRVRIIVEKIGSISKHFTA